MKRNTTRVVLVTGANRGIGLEIARQMSRLKDYTIILSGREQKKVLSAAEQIASSSASESQKVVAMQLDVTKKGSVQNIALRVEKQFGQLDALVNNAAILIDETDLPGETDPEIAKKTFETNLLGPWRVSQAFIPQMRKNNYGRIVNVSSSAGTLESVASELYSPSYSLSKVALNALTLMLARELRGTNVLVNAMDPGWVRTDMGGVRAPRSVQEGADTAVWLATLPDGGPSGQFFRDRKQVRWEEI